MSGTKIRCTPHLRKTNSQTTETTQTSCWRSLKAKLRASTTSEVDRNYAEQTQEKRQTEIEETLVKMLQLGNSSASNGMKTALARFLESIVIAFCSGGAAEEVMSQCFERWSQSDTFTNAVVKRIVSNPFFIRPVAGFIKQHIDSAIDKYRLTQLHAETEKVDKTGVPLPPSRLSSDATKMSENTLKRE